MNIDEIVNIILSDGLVGTMAAIGSLHAIVRKTKAGASESGTDAETVRMDNAENATRILMENTIKPSRNEFNETKEELSETKEELARNTREMARLRKALGGANGYEHRDGYPVLDRLYEQPKERDCERGGADRGRWQHRSQNTSCDGIAGAKVGSEPDPEHGQPS